MTRAAPVAVVLRCPVCGHALSGLDADRAWACPPCAHAWEVEGRGLSARPYRVWRRSVGGPPVWLPFWRVAFRAEVACYDAHVRAEVERAASRGRAWVRAFWLDAAFQMGDPGQVLTESDADAHAAIEADRLPAVQGVRIGSAEAVRLAELFVLARADREIDVSPATIRLDVREVALVAVPFRDAGRDLVCAATGRTYRKTALPDLP